MTTGTGLGELDRSKGQLWRWAAALIDPTRAEMLAGDGETVDAPALVTLLQRNKVPLLSLPETGPLAERLRAAGPAWAEAVAAEQREFLAQRREFARLRAALDAEGVPYMLIKAVGCPPSLPYRSDNLDLLVREEDTPAARRLLLALDYVELRNVEEPQKFLFRRFAAGRSLGALHLHERVGWGTGFMDEEALWSRARPPADDPGLLIPAPGDALLITMAHAFYEDKRITLGDLQRVLWCLRREPVDWEQAWQVCERRGWLPGYLAMAALLARAEKVLYGETSWPPDLLEATRSRLPGWARRGLEPLLDQPLTGLPWRLPFAYSKRHYYHKVLTDRALPARQKAIDALKHTAAGVKRRLKVRSQRPFFVALHGIDGAGKTAHAEALVASFQICDLRARRSWSRLASSPRFGWLMAGARRLTGQTTQPVTSVEPRERLARRRQQLRSPLLRAGFLWLTALDLWLGYLRQVAWPLCRGEIVVADRYILDAAAELGQILDHPAPGRLWAVRLLRCLSPRPRLAYLLVVPPAAAAERSATPEAEELLAAQAALRQDLASRWQAQALDNSQPFDQVNARLTRDVLRQYYRRFWTLQNALFLSNPKAPTAETQRTQKR